MKYIITLFALLIQLCCFFQAGLSTFTSFSSKPSPINKFKPSVGHLLSNEKKHCCFRKWSETGQFSSSQSDVSSSHNFSGKPICSLLQKCFLKVCKLNPSIAEMSLKFGFFSKKKVLILMSDTGGGHRASAQALDQALRSEYPHRFHVQIMDIWTEHANWPYNKFVPVYRFLAKNPILWRAFYAYGSFSITKRLTEISSWRSSYSNFEKAIENVNPDLVVSVHPLCQLMPVTIVQNMNKRRAEGEKIPFVTIVTDLGSAHRTWFDNRVDAYYVPSEAVRKLAIKSGISPNKIMLRGLPIRPTFWKETKEKIVVRKELGLSLDAKTVLLMGGGDGVGGIAAIASAVSRKINQLMFPSQLIVICGHNKRTFDILQGKLLGSGANTTVNSNNNRNCSVLLKGFVDNIDQYMAASDCLITKAGPGTIAESMIRGLPMILSSFLPGQESGNVPYVVNGGFGIYTGNRPNKIADTVSCLFQNETRLHEMSVLAKAASHQNATIGIANEIGSALLRINTK